jgi:menaquinone-dependent protoporphyrinogen oxidase
MVLPRLLVLYGTATGQTQKIARALGQTIRGTGVDVDVVRAEDGSPDPSAYASVIVAAPVRGGRYPRAVRRWVTAHAAALHERPTAFVSVCLAVLDKNPKTIVMLDNIMQRFFAETGWRPATTKVVAGALLYRQYNWITRWIMRRIVARANGDVDTSRDYEYTDWTDLKAFGREYARGLAAATEKAAS